MITSVAASGILSTNYLGWASLVVVPLLIMLVPLLYALIKEVKAGDKRNTTQHAQATEAREDHFHALEERMDSVLSLLSATHKMVQRLDERLDTHLQDHHDGVA
jgi:hypothetical protein